MIISRQKCFDGILSTLGPTDKVFLVGCAKCATVCKSGGEEEIWQMQEALTAAGKEVTGSLVIDEACHMLRVQREMRGKRDMIEQAEAILVLSCGAGVQSVASGTPKPVIAGLDTLFLGNIRRFGQFEQKCSLCGSCLLTETGGICPLTACPKGILNGPCGGMDQGLCETDAGLECAWHQIYQKMQELGTASRLDEIIPAKDFSKVLKPGKLTVGK